MAHWFPIQQIHHTYSLTTFHANHLKRNFIFSSYIPDLLIFLQYLGKYHLWHEAKNYFSNLDDISVYSTKLFKFLNI